VVTGKISYVEVMQIGSGEKGRKVVSLNLKTQ
jgi:hypothetical protein